MHPDQPTRRSELPPALPLVVHLGFAGSRWLVPDGVTNAAEFLRRVQEALTERIRKLPEELELQERHFLCGISQMAIGGDLLFARTCADLGLPHRVFLPQDRADFLAAVGTDGTPDFDAEQRAEAEAALDAANVIQERVVGDSADRKERFEDVNLEIARIADVVVCLVREGASPKPGGALDLAKRAEAGGKPVLVIQVVARHGEPEFRESWTGKDFQPPTAPEALESVRGTSSVEPGTLPEAKDYVAAVKQWSSQGADGWQKAFVCVAWAVIGSHLGATVLAAWAMTGMKAGLPFFLAVEVLLLAAGFFVHQWLHHSAAAGRWAVLRLVAEVARSAQALEGFHVALQHFFNLPMPQELRPLCRTMNVIHLRSTRSAAFSPSMPWEPLRERYLEKRVAVQVDFYRRRAGKAGRQLRVAHWTFVLGSALAILATSLKLWVTCDCPDAFEHAKDEAKHLLGFLAVVLPVLAVAGLSLAAAFDLEARHHTFGEMEAFLRGQEGRMRTATSRREFSALVLETEARLLGETVNWFSRRSFTGV